jgi:F-type H+-transporting ATPase subunit delta
MSTYRINTHYAKALILLSEETGTMDRVSEDMRLVERVCAENRELNVIFSNPVIPKDKKLAIVKELFGERVCKATMAFLLFVTRKNRSVNMRGIAGSYIEMYREKKGIILSDLVTHQPIDDVARKMVTEMVEAYTGKSVELHDRTDPKMLGCFKLEFDNKMYDARIRTKIRRMRIEFAKNEYESKL